MFFKDPLSANDVIISSLGIRLGLGEMATKE